MSTIDATVSILKIMPENERLKVYLYAKSLYSAEDSAAGLGPVGRSDILSDLEESRQQIADGNSVSITEILHDIGKRHGYI